MRMRGREQASKAVWGIGRYTMHDSIPSRSKKIQIGIEESSQHVHMETMKWETCAYESMGTISHIPVGVQR